VLEAEAVLAKARTDAEIIIHDGRLAAGEDVRKLRLEADQALAARRAERLAQEQRLAERETLINSQLARVLEAEKRLNEQEDALCQRAGAIESQQRELAELTRQELEQLQKLGGLTETQARTEFLKRVEDLEKIAGDFPGVEKTFAVQAGRELRVFVHPEQIGDDEAFVLARNIA